MSRNKENTYACEKCGGYTVTVDIDDGVTPFMLRCRAPQFIGGVCDGWAYSGMYRQISPSPPAWEWYRPGPGEKVAKINREHVAQGGLLLRARTTPGGTGEKERTT